MSTDHELLTEVRAVLREEVAEVTAGPSLVAAVRQKRARRRRTRRLGIAVTAVAAAVVVTAVVSMPEGTEPPDQAPVNAAYVMKKTSAALDGVVESILYERSIVTEGEKYSRPGEKALYERWNAADGSTFRLRVTIADKPVVDLSRDREDDIFVDYRNGTYTRFPGTEPSAAPDDDVWTPKEIQQAIADGEITVVGPGEPIAGRATVKLHREPRKADVPMDLWVDAKTYLPIRSQLLQEDTSPFDLAWLRPTKENLAQLKTEIPSGFTEQK